MEKYAGGSMAVKSKSGKAPLRGKLTAMALGIATALVAIVIVAALFGENFDDNGITGAVAGTSAALLLGHTLERLGRHALKAYFGLVFLNTITAALLVKWLSLSPEGTFQFLLYLLPLYLLIGTVDHVILRTLEKREAQRSLL
ncbi:hypothetical protein [Thermococcus sp. JdF3]|uniref:hypothetical protein n=1 Tax=Thermococcus sp. JdF3 TaxID=1638258 RepID=UPI00143AD6B3|nr:hypothetical protein [Thermococcus sp. JdF3]NJE01338.1 hypothetical protein [Thermococcus sp. JdF3]